MIFFYFSSCPNRPFACDNKKDRTIFRGCTQVKCINCFTAILTERYSARKKSTPIPIPTPTPICRDLGVGAGIGIAFEKTSMVHIGLPKNYHADERHHGPVAMNHIQSELLAVFHKYPISDWQTGSIKAYPLISFRKFSTSRGLKDEPLSSRNILMISVSGLGSL